MSQREDEILQEVDVRDLRGRFLAGGGTIRKHGFFFGEGAKRSACCASLKVLNYGEGERGSASPCPPGRTASVGPTAWEHPSQIGYAGASVILGLGL